MYMYCNKKKQTSTKVLKKHFALQSWSRLYTEMGAIFTNRCFLKMHDW